MRFQFTVSLVICLMKKPIILLVVFCMHLVSLVFSTETQHTWEQIRTSDRGMIVEYDDPEAPCVFPGYQYINTLKWSHSGKERKAAYLALNDSVGDILFEVIIDSQGKVVKARDVRAKSADDHTIKVVERSLKNSVFTSNVANETRYRTFYLIMRIRSDVGIKSQLRDTDG